MADAYVHADQAGMNIGTRSGIRVDGSPVTNAYLGFNVNVPTGETVTTATLKLFTNQSSSSGFTVHGVIDDGALTILPKFGLLEDVEPERGLAAPTRGRGAKVLPAEHVDLRDPLFSFSSQLQLPGRPAAPASSRGADCSAREGMREAEEEDRGARRRPPALVA